MADVQIDASPSTVWVNDNLGCCIGRFSAKGVDVHRSGKEQLEGNLSECLDCVHDLPFDDAWDRFKASMFHHHGVVVADEYKPTVRSIFG